MDLDRDPRRAAAGRHRRGAPAADRRRAALASPPLRRAAPASGCRSAPTSPASSRSLAERGSSLFCADQIRARAAGGGAARRSRPRRARSRSRSTGRRSVALVARRLPLRSAATRTSTASRCAARGPGRSPASRYDPEAAAARAREQAREFVAADRRAPAVPPRRARQARPARLRDRHRAARALVVGGARLAGEAASRRGGAGVRMVTLSEALERARARATAAAGALELGRGQGPAHLGLAGRWPTSPGRRAGSSCGCSAELRGHAAAGGAAARAARELLAAPGERLGVSRQARARRATTPSSGSTDHARAMLEAIHSPRAAGAAASATWRLTSSLAPLLEP